MENIVPAAGVTITGGKFIGEIGVVESVRNGWAKVLRVGQNWADDIAIRNLASR